VNLEDHFQARQRILKTSFSYVSLPQQYTETLEATRRLHSRSPKKEVK
jgi:hypothetical protein